MKSVKVNIRNIQQEYVKRIMKFGFNKTSVSRTISNLQFRNNVVGCSR